MTTTDTPNEREDQPMEAAAPAGMNPATGEIQEREVPRPFVAVLNDQREGALADELADELADKLAEVVNAVIDHEKPGVISLTLKVSPSGLNDRSVVITDTVKSKAPEPPREKTLFFAGKTGDLSRRNPRQMELEVGLREVPRATTPKEIK